MKAMGLMHSHAIKSKEHLAKDTSATRCTGSLLLLQVFIQRDLVLKHLPEI